MLGDQGTKSLVHIRNLNYLPLWSNVNKIGSCLLHLVKKMNSLKSLNVRRCRTLVKIPTITSVFIYYNAEHFLYITAIIATKQQNFEVEHSRCSINFICIKCYSYGVKRDPTKLESVTEKGRYIQFLPNLDSGMIL